MQKVKDNLIKIIDEICSSDDMAASATSATYEKLNGLKEDLEKGINTNTYRKEKGEAIRSLIPKDMPLYALGILRNTFLQGVDITKYSTQFENILKDLQELNSREKETPSQEELAQNHDRIFYAFRDCSSIIASRGINAVFTGSLPLYFKMGVESSREHSDVDFYIEEKDIYSFLKGLKESGKKFEFEDKRLSQDEGQFDRESHTIKSTNGRTGGGHQCQVKLIDPTDPKGYTEIGFFLSRQMQTESGVKTDFIKYYLDRNGDTITPIVVGSEMPTSVITDVNVQLNNGSVAQIKSHSFEYALKFKIGNPKARVKDFEDCLRFTQNVNLQDYLAMQEDISSIDKTPHIIESKSDTYPTRDSENNIVDNRTDDEKIVDEMLSTAELIVQLKSRIESSNDANEVASLNEQILSLRDYVQYSYSQVSTQNLIRGINDKMQVYEERLSMAITLDGLPASEPLTDENLESLEQDFLLKQQTSDEIFKILGLKQFEVQGNNLLEDTNS